MGTDGRLYGGSWYNNFTQVVTPATVNDGKWHSVALVVDGSAQIETLYVDGQIVGSVSGKFAFLGGVTNQIGTGYTDYWPSTPWGWFGFQGRIDDVRVWSSVRTASEVEQDETTAPSGNPADLAAYYSFDEGQGQTAHDQSSQHRDGTLAGSGSDLPVWSLESPPAIKLANGGGAAGSITSGESPNKLQAAPIIVAGDDGRLHGWLGGSLPLSTYTIEFFASAGFAADGGGKAEEFLGSIEVATDSSGQADFDIPFNAPAGKPVITATAIDPHGNTSELSHVRQANLEIPSRLVPPVTGAALTFSAGAGGAFALDDPGAGPLESLETWDFSLSVSAGILTLSQTAGLSGAGDGTSSLNYRGTIASLNAALLGMRYTPETGFLGLASVSVEAQSEGARPLSGEFNIAFYQVTTTADDGPGSLRDAINLANAASGLATVDFAIPGDGVQTISPLSPLPAITDSMLLDGFSQPGYLGAPLIELSGQSIGISDGLTITGAGATIRGLQIDDFATGTAIVLTGSGAFGNTIEANWIGTDSSGSALHPNQGGVRIEAGAHDNTVGGTDPQEGNSVASRDSGVVVVGAGSVGNRISSNVFAARGDDEEGLTFDGSGGYVNLPSFNLGGALTIEAWVKSDNVYANWARVIDFGDGEGPNNIALEWYGNTGQMVWVVLSSNRRMEPRDHGRGLSAGDLGARGGDGRLPGPRRDLLGWPAGCLGADARSRSSGEAASVRGAEQLAHGLGFFRGASRA